VYFKAELVAAAVGMFALAILSNDHVGFGRVHCGGDVSDEGVGSRNLGGCVSEGIQCGAGVLAVGEKEGRVFGGPLWAVVVCEFGDL
jgi:hypothetical protein